MEDELSSGVFLGLMVRCHYYLPTLNAKPNPTFWMVLTLETETLSFQRWRGGCPTWEQGHAVDVRSPVTLTHAEMQNVGTMLPEGIVSTASYKKKKDICYYSYLREKLAILKRIKFYLALT